MKNLVVTLCLLIVTSLTGPIFAQDSVEGSPSRISQTFQGLRVTPIKVETSRNGQARVILKLQNVTGESGSEQTIAVAFRAKGSGGLADFWKFNPMATAELHDVGGNSYALVGSSGLQFGIGANDWIMLRPGGSIPVTYSFSYGGNGRPGNLSFSAELHVVWPTESGTRTAPFQVYFPEMPQ